MNNHAFFKPANPNELNCLICNLPESRHNPLVNCDICGKLDFCTSFMTHRMCMLCRENEQKLQEISKHEAESRVAESLKRDNVTEVIHYSTDFFNAEVKSFSELKEIAHSDEDYCSMIHARIVHLQQVLQPGLRKALEESNAEVYILQQELNKMVPTLAEEWRKKFVSANIQYHPVKTKPVKIPTPKSKNPTDALAAQYLAMMEKRGTPVKPIYEAYHDGNMLIRTKDKSLAQIKAKESGGSVKEITAFEVAKQRVENFSSDEDQS